MPWPSADVPCGRSGARQSALRSRKWTHRRREGEPERVEDTHEGRSRERGCGTSSPTTDDLRGDGRAQPTALCGETCRGPGKRREGSKTPDPSAPDQHWSEQRTWTGEVRYRPDDGSRNPFVTHVYDVFDVLKEDER